MGPVDSCKLDPNYFGIRKQKIFVEDGYYDWMTVTNGVLISGALAHCNLCELFGYGYRKA